MARKKNLNPLNLKVGDWVLTAPRTDGYASRHGDKAVWEILELQSWGGATLHLVGGGRGDRCGAVTASLTRYVGEAPVKLTEWVPALAYERATRTGQQYSPNMDMITHLQAQQTAKRLGIKWGAEMPNSAVTAIRTAMLEGLGR